MILIAVVRQVHPAVVARQMITAVVGALHMITAAAIRQAVTVVEIRIRMMGMTAAANKICKRLRYLHYLLEGINLCHQ
ncbi:hypothetical protein [Paenibacillus sp. 481]|uniref:hypothetical protein n=1 Tax=Paenibacillus sp. 481 TaxID=2835869 RepID=UPI001E42DB37|nr:hypothetical protein [Paenibacillus sp. 481]UHA74917.1 hypothetical protein KIK04_07720 [Paenibacillus sp. 481]